MTCSLSWLIESVLAVFGEKKSISVNMQGKQNGHIWVKIMPIIATANLPLVNTHWRLYLLYILEVFYFLIYYVQTKFFKQILNLGILFFPLIFKK